MVNVVTAGDVLDCLLGSVEEVKRYPELVRSLGATSLGERGKPLLVGIGKASLSMAAVVMDAGVRPARGVLVVPHGYDHASSAAAGIGDGIRVVEAGHPVPDEASRDAASAILHLLSSATEGDGVLVLVSGGGSSLVGCPISGVSFESYVGTLRSLYIGGHDIGFVNRIRGGLSALAAGGLSAAAAPADVTAFILSDVPGDDPAVVASGPTFPRGDAEIRATVRAVREHMGGLVAERVAARLLADRLAQPRVVATVVGSNLDARRACSRALESRGFSTFDMVVRGDAAETGRSLVDRASRTLKPGEAIVFGGETTVQVRGAGRGGRCQELVVAAAAELARRSSRAIVGCIGTDGIDGTTDAAGAVVAVGFGNDGWLDGAGEALRRNDTYPLLDGAGALVRTGPTHTNVMDIGVIALPANP